MPDQTELDQLKALLADSEWHDLTYEEDVDGFDFVERVNGENRSWTRSVAIITRGPSGQHYRWRFEEGLNEDHPDFGPASSGDPKVTPVHSVEETVVVRKWVASHA
ncbi:hypothetical protein OG874_00190 [Nocardia sp. NBC_00565]|uniref:hypothetical protein n=1 Tax=Nocardia sp. NBC_00565 TaxID=2975993 RepID=UPI002E80D6E6|nr:hypothetical protein [Nocardia sp. NBC_00565]WUC03673.1 hypothetical protein OG874_00190 [Nocardia sp. NBC_00565]